MFGLHRIATQLLPLYPIDGPTHMGTTALIKAASCGHQSLVSLFMDHNADPTKHNWYGTALHAAAEAGMVGSIHELLDRGVDVDIEDKHGRSPLICAAQSGHTRATLALLERGADVDFFYRNKGTSLFVMVQQRTTRKVIKILLEFGADPEIPSAQGSPPLLVAAEEDDDDIEVARMLLDHGSHVNVQGREGQTPLQTAAAANNITHMQLFLDRYADIDTQSDDGSTALSFAVRHGNVDALALLLKKGANTEIADDFDLTPLDYAKHHKNKILERLLLDAGAAKAKPDAGELISSRKDLTRYLNGEGLTLEIADEWWIFKGVVPQRQRCGQDFDVKYRNSKY